MTLFALCSFTVILAIFALWSIRYMREQDSTIARLQSRLEATSNVADHYLGEWLDANARVKHLSETVELLWQCECGCTAYHPYCTDCGSTDCALVRDWRAECSGTVVP